jgi:hypothetical protein
MSLMLLWWLYVHLLSLLVVELLLLQWPLGPTAVASVVAGLYTNITTAVTSGS